jgi:hypothetical protein
MDRLHQPQPFFLSSLAYPTEFTAREDQNASRTSGELAFS